ncbi:restriction endonuclease subunit S [Campylobacterota bacterium DY0563]
MKNEKLRVPKLRFKDFSGEWKEKYFGDIYSFLQTNSFSRALLNYEDGNVKNIHYGDIHTKFKSNFYIQDETVPYINQDVDLTKIKEENYCKEKDLVIADASEDYKDIGKAIELIDLNNERLLAGLHTYIARDDKDRIALGFSGYFMQTHNIRVQMMKMATGISVLGISKGNLNKLELIIPQKQEQEKITSFLSSIDKKINQLSKKDELLQNYKKAMMQKIFSQKIRFKKADGSDYPKWEEKKLVEISLKISDGIHSTPTYDDKGLHYFINGNNLEDGKIEIDEKTKKVSEKEFLKHRRELDNTTILLSINGTIGKLAFYDNEKVLLGKSACYINIDEKQAVKYFIYNVIKTQNIQSFFYSELTGSTIKNLSLNTVKNTKINLPSLEEQTKIANFLSSLDTKISQNKKALKETQKFKKALLQKMFV